MINTRYTLMKAKTIKINQFYILNFLGVFFVLFLKKLEK